VSYDAGVPLVLMSRCVARWAGVGAGRHRPTDRRRQWL